jgi:hypothetical protein
VAICLRAIASLPAASGIATAPAVSPAGTAIARRPVMTHLRLIAWSLAAIGMVTVAGCSDDNTNAELHVHNNSSFQIVEIHVTSVGSTTWGENLLQGGVLAPNATLTIHVDCDFYDVRLIDEQGVPCEIHDVELCGSHADWVIENTTCTVFGDAQATAGANDSAPPAAP